MYHGKLWGAAIFLRRAVSFGYSTCCAAAVCACLSGFACLLRCRVTADRRSFSFAAGDRQTTTTTAKTTKRRSKGKTKNKALPVALLPRELTGSTGERVFA